MTARAEPVGGSMQGPRTSVLEVLAALGAGLLAWRFIVGLGPSTALSDGYPWGLWIAFDVVTGTALACGGYAIALLVYIFNKGRYHALVRPALLASALGYSLAAFAIAVDVGRPWHLWRIPLSPARWNLDSVLLEIALCVMAYVAVLWIELSPVFLARFAETPDHPLRRFAGTVGPWIEKLLPWLIALGLILPTMHQSSLGTLILLAGPRLHPLFNSAWVPLLFLMSCMAMGWAAVVMESSLSSRAFGRRSEHHMLSKLSLPIGCMLAAFLVLRLGDIVVAGKAAHLTSGGLVAIMFWIEIAVFGAATLLMLAGRASMTPGRLFVAAMMAVLAGTLYRFDAYLVAFNPGDNWRYFPSVPEIFITVGLVAAEIWVYIFIVRRFPILGGAKAGVSHG